MTMKRFTLLLITIQLCIVSSNAQFANIKSVVEAIPMDTLITRHILSKEVSTLGSFIKTDEMDILEDSTQLESNHNEADSLSLYYESIGYYQMALEELAKTPLNTLDQNRRYADLLFKMGAYEESLKTLGYSVLPEDSTYTQLNLAALCLERLKDIVGATAFRARIAHDYPLNESNLIVLSDLCAQQNDFTTILTYLNDYLYFIPKTQSIRRIRGINNFRAGDVYSSIKDLKILYNEGDYNPNTLYYLGHSYILKDSLPQAREVLGVGALVTDYKNAHILSDYAYTLIKENELEAAHKVLNKLDTLLNHNEEYLLQNFSLHELRGQAYNNQGQVQKAKTEYERALKYFPESELTLYRLIALEYKSGNTKREAALIERYLKLTRDLPSDNPGLKKRVSDVLIRQQQLKEQEFMNR